MEITQKLGHRKRISYAERTKDKLKHPLLDMFLSQKIPAGKAVEIGCGSGRDTAYLIKNGWEVLAIDIEQEAEKVCLEKLTEKEKEKFTFINKKFQEVNWEKCDLFLAFNVLHYCRKDEFPSIWKKIENSIVEGGFFLGIIFTPNHSFYKRDKKGTFLNQDEIQNLFKNFEIFGELKPIKNNNVKATDGTVIDSEIFRVMAQKKKNLVV